jgi:hypothetical protein
MPTSLVHAVSSYFLDSNIVYIYIYIYIDMYWATALSSNSQRPIRRIPRGGRVVQ